MNSPLQCVREAFRTALRLSDGDLEAVDYCMSLTLNICLAGVTDPIWGWLIAPPGAGKGELLRPFEDYPTTVSVSTLSPSGLVSAYISEKDDEDKSLLPKLNNKTLIIKEFSPILGMGEAVIQRIMGDLRDAYDGRYSKASGTLGLMEYKSRFGLVAAVTPKIEEYTEKFQELGERMLSLKFGMEQATLDDRIARMRHVHRAMKEKESWRKSLVEVVHTNLNKLLSDRPNIHDIDMPDEQEEYVLILADLLATMRTPPQRGTVSPEIPTRVLQQLINLGATRILLDQRTQWECRDTEFIRRVVRDSTPLLLRRIVTKLYVAGPTSSPQLARSVHIPGQVLSTNFLSHYRKLGILARVGKENYTLTPEALELFRKSKYMDGSYEPTKAQ